MQHMRQNLRLAPGILAGANQRSKRVRRVANEFGTTYETLSDAYYTF